MTRIIISLLKAYIYIGIVFVALMLLKMGSGGYMWFIYIITVPIVFGVVLIQIDNNNTLHEIKDELKNSNNNKTSKKEDSKKYKNLNEELKDKDVK